MAADTVLIVGGGLSGLTTAFYLGRAGIRSTILEKANRVGGLIKTDHIQGCDLEGGAESFIATKPAVAELAADLGGGMSDRIVGSNDEGRRIFVVRQGKLMPMPRAMSMMVPSQWAPVLQSPLLSALAKLKLLREPFLKPRRRVGDFSVGTLVREHFGEEMLELITEPLLAGVYGGESAHLSARSVLPRFVEYEERYGSLIKGVRNSARQSPQEGSLFRSFKGGMQTLIDELWRAVQGHTAVIYGEASKVERTDNGWRVRLGAESLSSKQVVLACPAWAGAKLLEQSAPAAATELAAIPYSSSILTMLVFEKAKLNHPLNGFGFLVPRSERHTLAAATWVNTKFPARVAEGLVALRGFIVSDKAAELKETAKEEILNRVHVDFERLMGFRCDPLFHTFHAWPNSMPQYVVGHEERINRLNTALAAMTGLSLAGNYFDGVGMPDSIRRAKQVAKQIEGKGV